MNNTVPSEVARYVDERSLTGRMGIVRVTGPVANDPVFEGHRSSPASADPIVEAMHLPPMVPLRQFVEGFSGWFRRIHLYEAVWQL